MVTIPLDASRLATFYAQALPDSLFYAYEMPGQLATYLATHNYSLSLTDLAAGVATPGVAAWLGGFLRRNVRADGSGAEVAGAFPTPAEFYRAISESVPELRKVWESLFSEARVDLLMLPTAPLPAAPVSESEPRVSFEGRRVRHYDAQGRFLLADSVAGLPSVSLPTGRSAPGGRSHPFGGLPGSLMLVAPRGRDPMLLAVAAAAEAALPAAPRAPPGPPACAGCAARLGLVPVSFPREVIGDPSASSSDGVVSASSSEVEGSAGSIPGESYVLDFEGDCEARGGGRVVSLVGSAAGRVRRNNELARAPDDASPPRAGQG